MLYLVLLAVVLVLQHCSTAANAACFAGGDGLLLPRFINSRTGSMCPDGYHCPASDQLNESTFPRLCPPTSECISERMSNRFCSPQGDFEPVVCPATFYCPDGRTMARCPRGSACPLGSWEPKACGAMSYCPSASEHELDLSGLFVALALSVVAGVAFVVHHRQRGQLNSRSVGPQGWTGIPDAARDTICDGVVDRRALMPPLTFSFKELLVDVAEKNGKGSKSADPTLLGPPSISRKVLLRSISGTIQPGSVTAVMGPSGAGKSVFFSTLLNKLGATYCRQGELTINGNADLELFRQHIGFVPQDDVLHADLTVEENIFFASELRLPRRWSAERRQAYRDAVIDALELGGVRNVLVGDDQQRGVSGGQRKRASLAIELCAAPAALFCDEISTGQDASTALDMCNILNSVAARSGMTVAMVIHQPRVEIWNALDQLLLIAPGGYTVYQGSRAHAQRYFTDAIGLDFSFGNPADIIVDGINQHVEQCIAAWREYVRSSDGKVVFVPPELLSEGAGDFSRAKPIWDTPPRPLPHSPFAVTDEHPRQEPQGEVERQQHQQQQQLMVETVAGAGFWRQVVLMHQRRLLKQSQGFKFLLFFVILGMLAAATMGSAAVRQQAIAIVVEPYTLLTPKPQFYIPPMLSMFYLIAFASTNSAIAIRAFGGEQASFWREASTGSLNRLAYYIGISVAELYRLLMTSLYFSFVAYVMWLPIISFWSFFLIQFLSLLCMDAQAAALGMLIRQETAPLLTSIFGVFVSLLNGFPGIPVVGVVAFSWYAAEALVSLSVLPFRHVYDITTFEDFFGYTLGRVGTDYAVMASIFFVYKALGLVLLVKLNRDKQR